MAHYIASAQVDQAAGEVFDLGPNPKGYIEISTVGAAAQYQLSAAATAPSGTFITAAHDGTEKVVGVGRLASGGKHAIGVPFGKGYTPDAEQPLPGRYLCVWLEGAGSITVIAS